MRKQVFERRKNTLATLVVFFVILSITAATVSAADEIKNHHSSGQYPSEQFPIISKTVGPRPVGAKPAIGTGLVTPATPGLITDPTYGVAAPATSGSKHSDDQQNDGKHSGEQHKGKKHSNKQYHNRKYLNEQNNADKNKA